MGIVESRIPIVGKKYLHHNGEIYEVLDIPKDSDRPGGKSVYYKNINTGETYVRSLEVWTSLRGMELRYKLI